MSRPPVDIGQMHLTVHALLGNYRERPGRAAANATRAADQRLARLRAALDLQDRALNTYDADSAQQHPAIVIAVIDARRRTLHAIQQQTASAKTPAPGLLDQLTRPLPARTGDDAGKVSSSRTGSKAPTMTGHLDLLALIESAVYQHDAALRDLLDSHLAGPQPWRQLLWFLPSLAGRIAEHQPHHETLRALDRDLRSWHSSARVLLGYNAPMVTISTACPHCNQVSLMVREDATSDVVCTTQSCIDPDTDRQSRWPRTAWQVLLEGRIVSGLVNTDAAALHLAVSPATVRDWKRRGLIVPAGGTVRYPLWSIAELDAAVVVMAERAQARQDRHDARAAREAEAAAAALACAPADVGASA